MGGEDAGRRRRKRERSARKRDGERRDGGRGANAPGGKGEKGSERATAEPLLDLDLDLAVISTASTSRQDILRDVTVFAGYAVCAERRLAPEACFR